MALKIVDQFDSSFVLDPDAKATLVTLLTSDEFCNQIQHQIDQLDQQGDYRSHTKANRGFSERNSNRPEFTGILFQPVPYTPSEPRGMPAIYESYYHSPVHIIINVPPNFMFKAKIFKPSRLCAIYQKYS